MNSANSCRLYLFVFFFKQKTAYETRLSLVGSEMCVRVSTSADCIVQVETRPAKLFVCRSQDQTVQPKVSGQPITSHGNRIAERFDFSLQCCQFSLFPSTSSALICQFLFSNFLPNFVGLNSKPCSRQ